LIVPLVLALAAFGLNAAQVDRDRKQEERRAAQERRVEERRAVRDRASAEDRAREETLATYLRQMSDLMTSGGRATADTQTLAQTITLVALRRLDGARKGLVVQFLEEADLLAGAADPAAPVGISLSPGCGTAGQHTCRRIGVTVYMENADLRNAIMPRSLGVEKAVAVAPVAPVRSNSDPPLGPREQRESRLDSDGGWFDGADLRNADFRGRTLEGVTFVGADLRGADFTGAYLIHTSFVEACLSGTQFDGVEFHEGADFSYAEGRDVDFSNARLTKATFTRARLTDVRRSAATTTGVRWPRDWTPTGLQMSETEARALCSGRQE
jgi:hypothetical protein